MRTTLAIDDDVLAVAKSIAARQRRSVGEVISDLARQSLNPPAAPMAMRNGVKLLPLRAGAAPVTPELVAELGEELP